MACSSLHHHHGHFLYSCHLSLHQYVNLPDRTVSQSLCFTKCANYSSRFRKIQRLAASESTNNGPRKTNSLVTDDRGSGCDPDPGPELDDVSGGSVSKSISALVHLLGSGFKLDGLGMEILLIALPATLALAADPIASLVDTAFVGHLGSAELAAVGVSGAVFNLVSKLFNVPLLNITTSFVAEEQASVKKIANGSHQTDQDQQSKILLPSVSTSIMLATALGLIETVALSIGSSFLFNSIGFTNAYSC